MTLFLILCSLVLQACAAAIALTRVPRIPHHMVAWGSLSAALVMMTARRIMPLLDPAAESMLDALLGLLVSLAALIGVVALKRLFRELAEQERELAEKNAELGRLATTDGLTGTLNRREFLRQLAAELDRGKRYHHPTCLVLFDLDHFKQVNDLFGHDIGDRALCAFCSVVLQEARSNDRLGRVGGEEFALLLPETEGDGAELLARRIGDRVAALCIDDRDRRCRFTVSAGVACSRPDAPFDAPPGVLRRADLALYAAKRGGRNAVRRYAPEMEDGRQPLVPSTPADPRLPEWTDD